MPQVNTSDAMLFLYNFPIINACIKWKGGRREDGMREGGRKERVKRNEEKEGRKGEHSVPVEILHV